MGNRTKLEKALFHQIFSSNNPREESLIRYRKIASSYAEVENAIAVLSDMQHNRSYIYLGRFANMLGLDVNTAGTEVPSIWEESLFRLTHPEDLSTKHLNELLFFHYIRRIPKNRRGDYYLMSRLRMRGPIHNYIPVMHRMFYFQDRDADSVRFALCLYTPLTVEFSGRCYVVNSTEGMKEELLIENTPSILSPREKQILDFINKGYASKEIAELLSISKNTVSRHRQEIIAKLQVRNSIEACRVAKELNLL